MFDGGYSLVPIGDEWVVRKYLSRRASRRFNNYDDALSYGIDLSVKHSVPLFIHHRNGTVINKILPTIETA